MKEFKKKRVRFRTPESIHQRLPISRNEEIYKLTGVYEVLRISVKNKRRTKYQETYEGCKAKLDMDISYDETYTRNWRSKRHRQSKSNYKYNELPKKTNQWSDSNKGEMNLE